MVNAQIVIEDSFCVNSSIMQSPRGVHCSLTWLFHRRRTSHMALFMCGGVVYVHGVFVAYLSWEFWHNLVGKGDGEEARMLAFLGTEIEGLLTLCISVNQAF